MIKSHKDLFVWQKGIELVMEVYRLTKDFPPNEKFGLVSQLRRAAVSIPSNIAEGRSRKTRKDFTQFLRIALGSTAELDTQLIISDQLSFISSMDYNKISLRLDEIGKMLNSMIKKLTIPKLAANSQPLEAIK